MSKLPFSISPFAPSGATAIALGLIAALYMLRSDNKSGVAFAISQLQEPQWAVRQVQPIVVFIAER